MRIFLVKQNNEVHQTTFHTSNIDRFYVGHVEEWHGIYDYHYWYECKCIFVDPQKEYVFLQETGVYTKAGSSQ